MMNDERNRGSGDVSERVIREYTQDQMEAGKRRKKVMLAVSVVLSFLLFVGVLVVCGLFFFRVETVTVSGNSIYSDEMIRENCGVEIGGNIFFVSNEDVAKNLGASLPFVYSVRLERHLPSTLELVIFEETPYFYFLSHEEYVVVSRDMKVLDITSDSAYMEEVYGDVRQVKMPDVKYAVAGESLVFRDEANREALQSVLAAIASSGLNAGIGSVDFRNRFDIKLSYEEGRFTVLMGNVSEAETKLEFAEKIIASFTPETTGTVCVDDIASGYAIVDNPGNLIKG